MRVVPVTGADLIRLADAVRLADVRMVQGHVYVTPKGVEDSRLSARLRSALGLPQGGEWLVAVGLSEKDAGALLYALADRGVWLFTDHPLGRTP